MDLADKDAKKTYHKSDGYIWIQGSGISQGKLFGGHTGLSELSDSVLEIKAEDFNEKILFIEDIAEFFSPDHLSSFFMWLGEIGALQHLRGIIVGKLCSYEDFDVHKKALLSVIDDKYGLYNLPIVANINFGHSSPICILPYDALAKIDYNNKTLSIIESGVV